MKFPVVSAVAALTLLPCAFVRGQAPDSPPKKAPLTTRTAVDALSDAELDQVIHLLKDNYIKPDALSDGEQHRATVQGLLNRLAPGAAIIESVAGREIGASPFRSEILDNRIGYVRLGAITAGNVGELDAALGKFTASKLPALVLDLRATPAGSEFEQTADICRRFCPKGKVLFSVKKPNIKQEQILTSKDEPKYQGILVALVDRSTAGNAEVIAAVLRTHVKALVIGQQTRGEAAEFSEFPLSNGRALRVAVAEVSLPESAPVFPGGVKPDLAVEVPAETTEKVLQQELEKGVGEFVFETERPRLNEAALVAGTNPDLDAAQAAQKNRGEKPQPPLRDVVLQRAVDFITTIAIYERKPAQK
ncbi:MAG: S41 family peptidase [Chthoniobacter sp.]|uniref:S41 family peptidase n=1 Tax=Chthoniobacter sp. TaxID=2510640 RepID=UPI0032A21847